MSAKIKDPATYYVVLLDGTPVGVSTIYSIAAQLAAQMETETKKTAIIPTQELVEPSVEPETPLIEDCECLECKTLSVTQPKP